MARRSSCHHAFARVRVDRRRGDYRGPVPQRPMDPAPNTYWPRARPRAALARLPRRALDILVRHRVLRPVLGATVPLPLDATRQSERQSGRSTHAGSPRCFSPGRADRGARSEATRRALDVGDMMQIVLARHGKPAWDFRTPIPGHAFGDWRRGEDAAPLDTSQRPGAELEQLIRTASCLIASPLRRSLDSAHLLAPRAAPLIDARFRE